MNQRQIDLALLAGIGVLLVAILVLALSAAPMRGGSTDNPPNVEQIEASAGAPSENRAGQAAGDAALNQQAGEDAPATGAAAEAAPEETSTAEDMSAAGAESGVEAGTEAGSVQVDGAQTDTTVTPSTDETERTDTEGEQTTQVAPSTAAETEQPAPAGTVNLDRVGFAFITAETGACSIPLQPWRQVAVSRDLLAQYGCGAAITLDLADVVNGNQQVTAQIADTMNPSFERTVNIFVGENEPALEYGVTTGTLQSAPR